MNILRGKFSLSVHAVNYMSADLNQLPNLGYNQYTKGDPFRSEAPYKSVAPFYHSFYGTIRGASSTKG